MSKLSDHQSKSDSDLIRDRHTGQNIIQTPKARAEAIKREIVEKGRRFTLDIAQELSRIDPPTEDK